MQITSPIDIEDALRTDLAPYLEGITVCAQPAPDDLTAGTVCIVGMGGGAQTAASYEYDLVAYAWAATPAEALARACEVCGLLGSMRYRQSASGTVYTTCESDPPYLDPDPDRPTIPRATVRTSIGARGVPAPLD